MMLSKAGRKDTIALQPFFVVNYPSYTLCSMRYSSYEETKEKNVWEWKYSVLLGKSSSSELRNIS